MNRLAIAAEKQKRPAPSRGEAMLHGTTLIERRRPSSQPSDNGDEACSSSPQAQKWLSCLPFPKGLHRTPSRSGRPRRTRFLIAVYMDWVYFTTSFSVVNGVFADFSQPQAARGGKMTAAGSPAAEKGAIGCCLLISKGRCDRTPEKERWRCTSQPAMRTRCRWRQAPCGRTRKPAARAESGR